ncbi:Dip2/Utp12 domain and WD-repeat protein, partial [Euroglyphus maynei]
WIALGSCPGSGNKYDFDNEVSTQTQLIVWEWQSESFILKQSGYSNSVTNSYECLAYSPDASLLITGGIDGRLKVWNLFTGFCVSMFTTEHKGPVTAVEFVPGKDGKVFVSCSLDGTVKAFDLNRYRCFRTLAAPSDSKPAQFISLAVDKIGGDFIAAGSHNFFEIFLWSLKTGRLLEMLSGHEAPVSSVKFSPNSNTLYSCSWDCTVRIWNLFEGAKHTREVIKLSSDALCLDIREDGHEFAVATLNGTISFYGAQSGDQLGIGIEGKHDLGRSRYKGEEVDDKYKYFSTFAYSVDGQYLVAAGRSKYVCIYNVKQKLLVKRFEISNNLSLDGFAEFISKRKMQEFGFDMDRIKHRDDESSFAPIALPGVMKSDYADRKLMPIIAVTQIRFSPTMRSFALASTEGVLYYSVDNTTTFNPYELDTSVTLDSYRENISQKHYAQALTQALKFNDWNLIQESLENIPYDQIGFTASTLSLPMVGQLLGHLDKGFEKTGHFEFYVRWVESILIQHACAMKSCPSTEQTTALRRLHQTLKNKHQDLAKIVKLPGPAQDKPNVYDFGTPYEQMYNDLLNKDKNLYTQNGILHMLDRNRRIKLHPEKFQTCRDKFDVIFTCEERVYDQVVEEMNSRSPLDYSTVHIINIDVQDNHEEATIGALLMLKMAQSLAQSKDLDNDIDELLQEFETTINRPLLHTIAFQ